MWAFYYDNHVHYKSYSYSRIAQDVLEVVGTWKLLFVLLICQIHNMEQRKNKNASEEETIAFNAKAKVESVVSIQIIMQHDEAQRQRKKLNNQEGHVKLARRCLNGLEYSMQPRYQDNCV